MREVSGIALEERGKVRRSNEGSCPELQDLIIGKDLLELLTSGMQVEPLAIYREYVQNAADAIDAARKSGKLGLDEPGQVWFYIDQTGRTVRIRDNGVGIAWPAFVERLTAVGASAKRHTGARGFRGVGRLAGLGFAREVTFRSCVGNQNLVSELRWDCHHLRNVLQVPSGPATLSEAIRETISLSRVNRHRNLSRYSEYPERFFEVELVGVIRVGSDALMNPAAIGEYLAQVAPVPFSPEFPFGGEIAEVLRKAASIGDLELHVEGLDSPVYRPHRKAVRAARKEVSTFKEVELFHVPSVDGGLAAVGWILHHDYKGALPASTLIRGLRFRSGNIQVGGSSILEDLFPEARFNSWAVGEIHVVDPCNK